MKRTTLILTILLVLSVSINLGIAGLILGHRLRGERPMMTGDAERMLGLVPDDLRPEIRRAMRQRGPELRERAMALRDARRDAVDALRQRPFDAAHAGNALADLRAEVQHGQEQLHQAIIDRMAEAQAAGTLPPPPDKPRRERGGDRPDAPPPPPPPPPED